MNVFLTSVRVDAGSVELVSRAGRATEATLINQLMDALILRYKMRLLYYLVMICGKGRGIIHR